MNKKLRNNSYGYKVCYKEEGNVRYIRYFMTYTYRQAVYARYTYIRYPPLSREDKHILKEPKWKIIPISKKEVEAGIWREVPF